MAKTIKSKPNPNGANQYLFDPRRDLCWEYYVNPDSSTFGNAYRSALKAKYEEETASQVTRLQWFTEKCRRSTLFQKAEKVLEETIEMETMQPVIGAFGPIMVSTGVKDKNGKEKKEMLYGHNDKLLKIKQDSSKFVADRLGKNKGYSTRQELTGADGKDLPTPIYAGRAK